MIMVNISIYVDCSFTNRLFDVNASFDDGSFNDAFCSVVVNDLSIVATLFFFTDIATDCSASEATEDSTDDSAMATAYCRSDAGTCCCTENTAP